MNRIRPAGFRRRALAILIDTAILFISGSVLQLILPFMLVPVTSNELLVEGLSWFVGSLNQFCFYGYTLSRMGTTPGKAVLSMRVLDDTNGTHLSFVRGGFRCALGYWISFIPLGIGYFMVAFRSDKKALHDLIFGSHVWYVEK